MLIKSLALIYKVAYATWIRESVRKHPRDNVRSRVSGAEDSKTLDRVVKGW